MENVKGVIGDKVKYAENQYDALEGADALIIVTEWSVFRTPNFDRISGALKDKVVFDGRNVYDLNDMAKLGYTYYSVGRETVK